MPLLAWSETMSVHCAAIDAQHKKMILLINELHEARLRGAANQVLAQLLIGLIDYTRTHFIFEEHYMESNAYPGLLRHRAEHQELARQVQALKMQFDRGEVMSSAELMGFLKGWLTTHILGSDQKYAAAIGPTPRPPAP